MSKPLTIQFDEAELLEKGKQIETELNKQVLDQFQKENLELQLYAVQFLQEANQVVELINKYNSLQQLQKQTRDKMRQLVPVDQNLYNMYNQTADLIRTEFIEKDVFNQFFKAVMIFNDQIIKIITGTSLTTVIIVDGADGPEIREYTIDQLLAENSGINFMTTYASKTYTLLGKIQINTTQLSQSAIRISQIEQDKDKKFNLIGLNIAYTDAKKDYLEYNPYAFFKTEADKEWQKIKVVGGLGDISEAYTAFFFLQKPPFIDSRWNNLAVYFREGVAKVDSVSGLYAADIYNEEKNRSYAVKAANASLPGYSQMIKLAQNILNASKKLDVNKLRQLSEQKQYKIVNGEKIRKGCRNAIETVLDFFDEFDIS